MYVLFIPVNWARIILLYVLLYFIYTYILLYYYYVCSIPKRVFQMIVKEILHNFTSFFGYRIQTAALEALQEPSNP